MKNKNRRAWKHGRLVYGGAAVGRPTVESDAFDLLRMNTLTPGSDKKTVGTQMQVDPTTSVARDTSTCTSLTRTSTVRELDTLQSELIPLANCIARTGAIVDRLLSPHHFLSPSL